ncbi:DNA gyrase inhibitor YacG [Sphingomonas sp. 179-I 2A4 NHS]|jgi:hypothetical protein|uniref:DNA gyrase inhibitor YacG n=1 Tax=unclassified Sphingomonas TaxID=196159 RepID=UPI00387945F0
MPGKCPICSAPSVPEHAPFCSRRCKDRDLLQWLSDGYRIPGREIDPDGLDSRREPD